MTYNLDDLAKDGGHFNKLKEALGNKNLTLEEMKSAEYADKIAYTTVDGNIPYFWRTSQPNDFVTSGGKKDILTYLRGGRNIHRYLRSQQCKLRPSRWSSST